MPEAWSVPAESTRLGALSRRLLRVVTSRSLAELQEAGFRELRPVHNVVLGQLVGGGARTTDLAARGGMTKQGMTLMVDHLEANGYVRRVPDPDDRRAKLVELTERGREAARAAHEIAERIERGFARRLGAERLRTVKVALGELLDDAP